jgi:hypothetical protein
MVYSIVFTATETLWHRSDEMSVSSSSVGFSEVCDKNGQFSIQHRLACLESIHYYTGVHLTHSITSLSEFLISLYEKRR